MRRLLIALFALSAAVVLVAGCGNSTGSKQSATPGSSSPGGAVVIPISAPFLVRLNTAFDSPQWTAFDALLKKFPDGTKLYSSIAGKGVDFKQIKPALGSETDVLALSADDLNKSVFVGLTQPKDVATFQALLAKGSKPSVSEEVAGWRVIADDRATIDRFKRARNEGVLSGSDAYKEAAAGLPADALATLYIDGATLTTAINKQAKTASTSLPSIPSIGWLSGALTAKDKGVALDLRLKAGSFKVAPFTAELPAQVPADVSLFVDFKGLDAPLDQLKKNPAVSKQLGTAEKALGGLLDEVIALFKGEGAFYIRSGTAGNEYTLVLSVADEQAAGATLDKLATLLGALGQSAPATVDIAGVSAKKLTLGKVAIYYAVFDGKLVITNATSGIEGLKAGGARLADSQAWKDGTAAAEMPDQTAGILYADVQRVAPMFAALTKSKKLSPKAKANLAPLGSVLVYGSTDGNVVTVKGFVSVR